MREIFYHILLKIGCDQLKISIKDCLYIMFKKCLRELKEKMLQNSLKKSIQQSKEGKVKSRGSFAKYIEDEI